MTFIERQMNNEEEQGTEQSTGYSLFNADTRVRYKKRTARERIAVIKRTVHSHIRTRSSCIHVSNSHSFHSKWIFFFCRLSRQKFRKNREKNSQPMHVGGTLFAFVCVSQFHIKSIRNMKNATTNTSPYDIITALHKRNRWELVERKDRQPHSSHDANLVCSYARLMDESFLLIWISFDFSFDDLHWHLADTGVTMNRSTEIISIQ